MMNVLSSHIAALQKREGALRCRLMRFLTFFLAAMLCATSSFAQVTPSAGSVSRADSTVPLTGAQRDAQIREVLPEIGGAAVAPAPAPTQNAIPAPVGPITSTAGPAPVVLELFTSQGCAFCPPADELMGQMIQQQGIIGLSCHVDYFSVRTNDLGKGFCTRRQSDYNRKIGTGPRYTPQLVVNGSMDMIGYEAGKISAAILKARAQKVVPIAITPAGGGAYSFSLPNINLRGDTAQMWLAIYDGEKSLAITEGNNLGKKITYHNVVSHLDDLGAWDGTAMARAVNVSMAPPNEGFVLIVQNARTGHIIAAGQTVR